MSTATSKTSVTTVTTTVSVSTNTVALDGTHIRGMLADFNNVKETIKRLEKQKSEMDKAIRDLLGDATVGTFDGLPVVELAPRSRTSVDSALLKLSHPEAFEQCSKTTTYDIIVAK